MSCTEAGYGSCVAGAEIERDRHDALLRHGLVAQPLGQAVALAPGAAVALDQRRERPLAFRLEHAREQRLVAVAEVLDVLDVEVMRLCVKFGIQGCSRHGEHLLPIEPRRSSPTALAGGNRPCRAVARPTPAHLGWPQDRPAETHHGGQHHQDSFERRRRVRLLPGDARGRRQGARHRARRPRSTASTRTSATSPTSSPRTAILPPRPICSGARFQVRSRTRTSARPSARSRGSRR